MAQRLRAAGLSASSREGLGSNVIFGALAANDIDVYVDYSGTLWANQFQRTDIRPRAGGARRVEDHARANRTSRCSANSVLRTPMRW